MRILQVFAFLCFAFLTGINEKCTLVQALRLCTGRTAHRGSRGIALLGLCTGRTAHRGSRGIVLLRLCTGRTAHRGSRGIVLLFHDQQHYKGVRGQRHAPAALYPREKAGTHCTGGLVAPQGWSEFLTGNDV